MKLAQTFKDCKIAVLTHGNIVLVEGPVVLSELMDGDCFDDNSNTETLLKMDLKPGFYVADVEYWFEQGYFEGYPAPGESDYDFRFSNVRKVEVR